MIGSTNAGGGGGAGGTLVVSGVAGHTITATKDGKTYTRTCNSSGTADFKGLATGEWSLTMAGGGQTASSTVAITVDYSITMAYFAATIAVTYPEGSICTCTDGATTLTAPDTSGSWAAIVPSAGTWTVSCTDGTDTTSKQVDITTDGQSESITLSYELILFDGQNSIGDITAITGGWNSNMTNEVTDTTLSATKKVSGESSKTVYYYLRTENKISLTEYSTLSANIINSNSGNSYSPRLGISEDGAEAIAYTVLNNVTGEKTLDISSYTGEYYIGFFYSFNLYGTYNLSISADLVQLIP